MSDDMMMNGEEPIVPEGTVEAPPAPPLIKPGMAKRNVLLIVAGVIVLVALVGFVAYALLLVGSTALPGTPSVTPGTPVPSATPSTTPTAAVLPVPDIGWRDVFAPRNPFKVIAPIQLVVAETEDDDDDDNGTNNNSNSDADEDTLSLENIVTEDGVRKAVVKLDGTTYTLAAGEQVGDSDWSIVEVNEETAVVLYGDVRIELSIGQGSDQ